MITPFYFQNGTHARAGSLIKTSWGNSSAGSSSSGPLEVLLAHCRFERRSGRPARAHRRDSVSFLSDLKSASRCNSIASAAIDVLPKHEVLQMELSQQTRSEIFESTFFRIDRPIAFLQLRPRQPSPWIQWSTSSLLRSHSHGAVQRQQFSPQRSRQFRAQKFAPDARRNRLRDLVQRVRTASVLYLPRMVTVISLCAPRISALFDSYVANQSRESVESLFCFSNALAPARRLGEERQGG